MEKTNKQIVFELIKTKPIKSGEILNQTSISRSSLTIILSNLIDEKIIRKDGSLYKMIFPTPSVKDIYEDMKLFHQQRLMDYKYRKMTPESKLDCILVWYIENPTNIKGYITDYNETELENNIFKAISMMKHSV